MPPAAPFLSAAKEREERTPPKPRFWNPSRGRSAACIGSLPPREWERANFIPCFRIASASTAATRSALVLPVQTGKISASTARRDVGSESSAAGGGRSESISRKCPDWRARQCRGIGRHDGVTPAAQQDFSGQGKGQAFLPQQFLYFLPLPQGQGSLRPIFCTRRGCFFTVPSPPTLSPVALATRSRLISSSFLMRTE